jgi:hypothetical protein
MIKSLLSQAQAWGFLCQRDHAGNWQILPQQSDTRWKLQQAGDRWLLLIGDVPQVNLPSPEAIAFLERRLGESHGESC